MNFSIQGVDFTNKGAELMLHAVKQQVQEWNPSNTLSANLKVGSFAQRQQAGIHHLAYQRSNKIPYGGEVVNAVANLIPKFIRQRSGIVLESEVDGVLDASGFAFSDQWGPEDTEKMAELCLRWKRQGKKTVLLPQAFGPFTSPRIKQAFVQIINNVDLIFARDDISYQYLSELSTAIDHVKIAPDFTNLVKGVAPDYIKNLVGRPCIIPNYRMIDKTASTVSTAYLSFLALSIEHLLAKGFKPFILIHERNDSELGVQLQAQISQPIPVVKENNPLFLKGILGQSYLVIGSRFHGLISALSQGVPCLGAGWSHKYKMLFKSYGCSDLLVDIEDHVQQNLDRLNLIIQPTRSKVIESVEREGRYQKSLSLQMWSEVRTTLGC